MQGRIIENKANLYMVKAENLKIYTATARGKFKCENLTPVVGDNVEIEVVSEEKLEAVIEKVNDRSIYIKRPKLANITQIIFVLSCRHPKPDLLLLDKQLAYAEFLGLKANIVLNKIDLSKENEFDKICKIYESLGYTVIKTNAKENVGTEGLLRLLQNNISAFAGNSGVGKSTLLNDLFNGKITLEGEISQKNKKGKNTTTNVSLYEINEKTYIADTPGFSTFDIYEIPYKELDKYFIEFRKITQNCKYIGCSHIKEEECGINKAVLEEKISDSRYKNYVKIYEELKDKEIHKW